MIRLKPAEARTVRALMGKRKTGATVAQKASAAIPTEMQEQTAVIDWWNAAAASYGLDPRLLCASANGAMLGGDAKLRAIQAGRLKKAGMRPGYPDLFLARQRYRGTISFGLFIELKRQGWKPPTSGDALKHWENQQEIHRLLSAQGFDVFTCLGADHAIAAIKEHLS